MYSLITDTWSSDEVEAINAVVASNRFSMGPKVKEFEAAFAKRFDCKHAICVNSGSSANMVMVAALYFQKKLKPDDEGIVPAVGWSTTYSPLFFMGLKVVFVDVDPITLNIDVEKLQRKITERTRAILTVNLLGKPSDLDAIKEVIGDRPISVLEDNCEAMGAQIGSRNCGTIGEAGSFSFFFSHHITTIEGGMITTNDDEIADYCRVIRAHGWLRDVDTSSPIHDYPYEDEFRKMFWFVVPSFNVRPTEFTGAVGITQLEKFDSFLKFRKTNHRHFFELMKGHDQLYTQSICAGHSAFSLSVVLKPEAVGKVDFPKFRQLVQDEGIEVRPIASGDITKHPMVINHLKSEPGEFPSAEHIDKYGFMMGNHPRDVAGDISDVFNVMESLLAKCQKD